MYILYLKGKYDVERTVLHVCMLHHVLFLRLVGTMLPEQHFARFRTGSSLPLGTDWPLLFYEESNKVGFVLFSWNSLGPTNVAVVVAANGNG